MRLVRTNLEIMAAWRNDCPKCGAKAHEDCRYLTQRSHRRVRRITWAPDWHRSRYDTAIKITAQTQR